MTQTTERSDAVPPTGLAPDTDLEALAAVESAGPQPEPVPAASADAEALDDTIEAAPERDGAPEDPVIDSLDAAHPDGAERPGEAFDDASGWGQESGQESSQELSQESSQEPGQESSQEFVGEAGPDDPLLDSDLEQGIATIFAALHSATDGASWPDAGTPAADDRHTGAFAWLGEDDEDVDVEAVDLSTFRLLGELDRLWHRAA
jgi:hypothetical protein